MEQSYDIAATYAANYERGPKFESAPVPEPPGPTKTFLGRAVRSRLGIAAGLLLNSKWLLEYGARGYDLLTYKTVRSSQRDCYPLPNWVFVEPDVAGPGVYRQVDVPSEDPLEVSSSVCFGMPSAAPESWRADVRKAKEHLSEGQLLIVSVVATPEDDWTQEMVADDFRQCAEWAVEAGADVIEANFSCPNVCSAEGSIYLDPVATKIIASEVRGAIGDTPLLIKTGQLESDEAMSQYLHALDGIANGVTLVNCLIGRVFNTEGRPVFGDQFAEAGVLGRAIHDPCVEAVRRAARVIDRDKLTLEIAAVGGVACEEDVERYFEAGAQAVMMGSSPMYLPNLARELKAHRPEW